MEYNPPDSITVARSARTGQTPPLERAGTVLYRRLFLCERLSKALLTRLAVRRAMLLVGTNNGVYRLATVDSLDEARATKRLDSGRVMRLRTFDAVPGAFAATKTGLYHSPDGREWTDLGVPTEKVYAVGADTTGERLYAGTRPAAVYVAELAGGTIDAGALSWRELDGFQDLPSRSEWRLPRHDDLAQVRDVHVLGPNRVVAGVEVGGVHLSDDGGETWAQRRDGVDDDIHELHPVSATEWLAATGHGLYHTTDAGETWLRLDDGIDQRYFRSVVAASGTVYAGGALANSSTWDDDDADPELFRWEGRALEPVSLPTTDETVTGLTSTDGRVVAGTHRGTLLVRRSDGWVEAGQFPVPGTLTGRYTPLTAL
jgi:hypothetical protein